MTKRDLIFFCLRFHRECKKNLPPFEVPQKYLEANAKREAEEQRLNKVKLTKGTK
jgi:hypothetical protein